MPIGLSMEQDFCLDLLDYLAPARMILLLIGLLRVPCACGGLRPDTRGVTCATHDVFRV